MASLQETVINDSGSLILPKGSIADRPSNPELGQIRYNTDLKKVEHWNGFEWIVSGFAPSPILNGLTMHLDASVAESYPASGNVWTDLSGNGNDATFQNSVSYADRFGGVVNFSSNGDHCTFPSITIGPNGHIDVWLLVGNKNYNDNYASRGIFLGTGSRTARLLGVQNTFGIDGETSDNGERFVRDNPVFRNGWNNFQSSWNNFSVTNYINGVVFDTRSVGSSVPFDQIGCSSTTASYIGDIASVKLYNRPLSEEEVLQNFFALRERFDF